MFESIASTVEAAIPVPATSTQPTAAHTLPTYTSPTTGQVFKNEGYQPDPVTPPVTTDWEAMYESQRIENGRLKTIMDAAKISPSSTPGKSVQAAITADRVKATVSPTAFLKMTRDDKERALGIDPTSVTDDGARKIFGRGADPALGIELHKASALRYSQVKQVALLLNIYGA
jgi:hypothetical protein